MDRGYFSFDLLKKLNKLNTYPIFRLKSNLVEVKKFLDQKNFYQKIIDIPYNDGTIIKFKLIKYYINGKAIVLGTTLTNQLLFPINTIKDFYHTRWEIETYFRYAKYCQSFKNFHTYSEKKIKQEISIHVYISIMSSVLAYIYCNKNQIKKGYIVNYKNFLDKLSTKIIILLFYKNKESTCSKIERIGGADGLNVVQTIRPPSLKIIFNNLVKIQLDRNYARTSIIPPSGWYNKTEINLNNITAI